MLSKSRELNTADLVAVLKRRFEIEQMSRYFTVAEWAYSSQRLSIDTSSDALLLEFPTPVTPKRSGAGTDATPPPPPYRLLIVLALRNERDFTEPLRADLDLARERGNIDHVVVWTHDSINVLVVRALKRSRIDILHIKPEDVQSLDSIPQFITAGQADYDYAIALNTVASIIFTRLKKLFHLVLSEVAAPTYDDDYGKDKYATQATMDFEEQVLAGLVEQLGQHDRLTRAIDVGCGTGRHTFLLAPHFAEVFGFDFSQRMIEKANEHKKRADVRNVSFDVGDLEHEDLAHEATLQGNVDLVVASFGMGSFIEDTPHMLGRFHSWLRGGGYAFVSFYNSESVLLQVKPNWRDTALSAQLDPATSTLQVELTPKSVFYVYCKPYSDRVALAAKSVFEIETIYTFPTLMALMPNSLLSNELARTLFRNVDEHIATTPAMVSDAKHSERSKGAGHYVLLVLRKGGIVLNGLERVMQLVQGSRFEILDHPPVLSIEDARGYLSIDGPAVKTVVFQDQASGPARYFVVVVLAPDRVSRTRLAKKLDLSKARIATASPKEVVKLGFPLGGVAPFGFEPSTDVRLFIDDRIDTLKSEWLFTGAGDNRKTLKIRTTDFQRLVTHYERISIVEGNE